MTQQTPQEADKNSEIVDRLVTEYHNWVMRYRMQVISGEKLAFMTKDVMKIIVRVLGHIQGATKEEIEADLKGAGK